jgi:NADPH:quinone reductase
VRAAEYRQRGAARAVLRLLNEEPDPVAGAGEVRVRIATSGVNPSDVKARALRRGAAALAWPRIVPHQDGAGVIDAVGDGVSPSRIGQRVWLYMAQAGRPDGTAAQYCVVPEQRAVLLPDGTGFEAGAMLGVAAMTAHYAVFDTQAVQDRVVLVHGGAGAVGFYATQLARLGGAARVIATVSGPDQAEQALRAGADLVLNRHHDNVVQAVRDACGSGPQPVDRIVDVAFGANQDVNLELLANGGTIAAYGSDAVPEPVFRFWDHVARNATLRTLLIYLVPNRQLGCIASDLVAWLGRAALVHPRAHVYGLADIASAHEQVERGGTVGKVLIDLER